MVQGPAKLWRRRVLTQGCMNLPMIRSASCCTASRCSGLRSGQRLKRRTQFRFFEVAGVGEHLLDQRLDLAFAQPFLELDQFLIEDLLARLDGGVTVLLVFLDDPAQGIDVVDEDLIELARPRGRRCAGRPGR